MKFIIFYIFNLYHYSHASLLLIPSTEVKYETYAIRCAESEYLCTTDYFLSLLRNHKTPRFDKLMDAVDLSSAQYINEFQNKIINILNSEEIDKAQLSMLINLLKQINSAQPTLLYDMIENELKRLKYILDNSVRPHKKEFVFIFKEMISMEDAKKIRTTFIKIPLYIIHYSSAPYKTNTFSFNRVIKRPLLAGRCGSSLLTYQIESAKYCMKAKIESADFSGPSIAERYH